MKKKEYQLSQTGFQSLFESAPGLYLALLPGLTIVAVSNAYLEATMTKREDITGRNLFEVFPDNPDDRDATGVSNLRASLEYVIANHTAHTMAIQRYDIRRPDGTFEERYWSPLNKPVLNKGNEIELIIHRVEDVTAFVRLKKNEEDQIKLTAELRAGKEKAEIEMYKRAQEIQEINKRLLNEIVERKKSEEKLRRSEERYHMMINEVEDYAILLLDINGTIMNWSKGAEKIKGYKQEKIVGKNFRVFYTKEDKDSGLPEKLLEEARQKGKAIHEGWRVKEDKSIFWGNIVITALHDDKNNIIGFSKVTRDQTERKKLEDQLIKFNEELEKEVSKKTIELTNILERITDGFIGFDKNFNYTYANKKIGEMIMREPAALIGKNIWEEFPDVVGSETYKAFTQAMAEQRYISNIDHYPPLSLWQENHIYPSPDGASVFIRDITEQQKAAQKIEKEMDFSNSIINSLPGVFYLFDKNGKMLRWNKNFEKVSGYTGDEISRMVPTDFFDDGEKAYLISRIEKVFAEGISDAEANFFTKSRKKIPFYFTGIIINLEKEPCLIGMGIDVSKKVKAEEELKKSYKQLRALTSHLQNIREEERAHIAREIHDELGQQLTGIKMDVAWISRRLDKENEINEKITSILQLTDETIKTVRRIATELRPSILDDLGLIAAMEWHSGEFEKRFGIKTIFNTELKHIDLRPDISIALFRIYQESLTNTLRHAHAEKISSSLRLKNDTLILSIIDNGIGFDVSSIANKKTLGILGMKERSLIMGGHYEINSKQGEGTVVTVSVPLSNGKL